MKTSLTAVALLLTDVDLRIQVEAIARRAASVAWA